MSSAAFTCITCRVAFADADLQRHHYKTDWHRYNLKRKVASLPHVTAEGFNQRVLAQRAQAATEEHKATSFYCEPCGKKISSQAAYEHHMSSAKHKARLSQREQRVSESETQPGSDKKPETNETTATTVIPETASTSNDVNMDIASTSNDVKMDTDTIEEDVEEWDDDVLGIEECLFCSKISKSLPSNVKHMTSEHSFFIPDIEYLVDLEGFITYLGEKVGSGKMCLWCNDRSKMYHTVRAAQQHMVDKGHCMLLHDDDTSYEYADFYDYTSSYPEGGNPDDEVKASVLDLNDEDYEMTLPSGAKIGHRALAKFYKQNLVSRVNPNGRAMVGKVMSHYKALGWTGASGSPAAVERRVKDLQYMQRVKRKHWEKLGIRANKTAQHHFRPQVIF